MNFNISGEYVFKIPLTTMFLNTTIKMKHHNLITFLGECYFMNRCLNDYYNPMEYIVIGNGVNAPNYKDEKLGNETARNTASKTVDVEKKQIVLTTSFSAEEILGSREIGVCTTNLNGTEILISHDVFYEETLSENFINGVVGLIEVEYIFQFSTSQIKTGWEKVSGYENVYYVFEPNMIVSIFDATTNNGLRAVNTLSSVENTKNSYWYDYTKTNNVYVHLYHDNLESSPNPNTHEILIQNK